MTAEPKPTTPEAKVDPRLAALRRFAVAISILTILGHAWLGFEVAVLHVLLALHTAYASELLLDLIEARTQHRPLRFVGGGFVGFVDFLLPAHITGLACAMLLYPNAALWPVVFATSVAVGSKYILRTPADARGRSRHFMNPSNTGIATTLLLFPWVGVIMPYQFTEAVSGPLDWIIPGIIVMTGSMLNAVYTKRIPLIATWLAVFATQAIVRALVFGTPVAASLTPMSGMAFLLFTFYMVSDPGTTPMDRRKQIYFGMAVGLTYAVLLALHVVYTLFFALALVCLMRGIGLHLKALRERASPSPDAAAGAGA